MKRLRTAVCWIAFAFAAPVAAVAAGEIKILSAGAVEPGLAAVAAAYQRDTGNNAVITYNTSPEIRKRLDAGETWDVVIAPPTVIDELAKGGKFPGPRTNLGRVGIGVAVRSGAPAPDIATAPAFQSALLAANSVVFNRASTGLYVETLLKRMGIYDQIAAKTTRYDDGAAVMDHLRKGSGNEIGFGAITEILLQKEKGVRLVGPLPAEIQNYTTYTAVAAGNDEAQRLVRYLESASAKALIAAAGIEP